MPQAFTEAFVSIFYFFLAIAETSMGFCFESFRGRKLVIISNLLLSFTEASVKASVWKQIYFHGSFRESFRESHGKTIHFHESSRGSFCRSNFRGSFHGRKTSVKVKGTSTEASMEGRSFHFFHVSFHGSMKAMKASVEATEASMEAMELPWKLS